ncbi:ABC transporter permease [Pyrolobus fumarii]|nr:ABC transporter permease [Pyrolobus fumarii]
MRWLVTKALTIPIVLFVVVSILVALTTPILDQIMMKSIEVEIRRAIFTNPQYANVPMEIKLQMAERMKEELIKALGLDQPWYVKMIKYTFSLLTFQPIYARVLTTRIINPGSPDAYLIVLERIPFTVYLFTTSSILTMALAIPLGLLAARRPGGIIDRMISTWSIFSISMPWWWVAMVMIWVFAYQLRIFPGPEYQTDWTNPVSVAYRAALPVLTITLTSTGVVAYRIRSILLDILTEDFVMTERAKGVPERMLLFKHVLRVAAPPIVTMVLLTIVLSIVSGAILTEAVFNWFGLGTLYWEAVVSNDIPVILVLTYISTLLYLITRFVLDILYTILDPRIRRA